MKVELRSYDIRGYYPGAGPFRRAVWYVINAIFFDSWFHLGSAFKCRLLRAFGARVGARVVIKPRVNIKYPWHLEVGDDVWIGEGAWLDNLARITIGSDICISQDAYLLTGNHDYSDPRFGLITREIVLGDGSWVGARAVVCPGVCVGANAVITVGSILTNDAAADGIYRGNPATREKKRAIQMSR